MLAMVGTEFLSAVGDDIDEATILRVLSPSEAQVRGQLVAEPPTSEAASLDGMGAWHVNAETECHYVESGTGVVQVVTPEGIVTAWIEGGDVMIMRGGEHRYRPLTVQTWRARHSGAPEADLGFQGTDRAGDPWPLP